MDEKTTDLEKPQTVVIDADYMHLQDLGNATYTEFDNDSDIIDLYEQREELMERRCGLIHSHHTMAAFFSGTDQEELHEKAETGLYLSLIVNNHMEPVAKLAWMGEMERTIEQYTSWQWGTFQRDRKKYTRKEMCNVIYEIELDIEFDQCIATSVDRYKELDEDEKIKSAARAVHNNRAYGGVGTHGRQGTFFDKNNPVPAGELPRNGVAQETSLAEKLIDDFKINRAFAVILTQDPKTKTPGIHGAMTVAMNDVKETVDVLLNEGEKIAPSDYEEMYIKEAKEYAQNIISGGDDIIAEWLGEFYIADEDYYAILGKMYDGLTPYEGIFAEALKNTIIAVCLDDEDEDEDENISSAIVDSQGRPFSV